MDYNLTEEQEMLKKVAQNFFANELPKSLVEEMATDIRGFTPEIWNKMSSLGWMGLIVPEEYGGSGGSMLDLVVLLEEMGRACLPGPFFSTVVLGELPILEFGNEEQKRNLLPKIVRGEAIVTIALTEPQSLNSLDSLQVGARADVDGYLIEGIKLFVTDAHVADYIVCVTRTEGGITFFLVDTKSQGLICTLLPTVAGDKQCEVRFDGVSVTKENILGVENGGLDAWEMILPKLTIAKCAEMLGGAQRVLEMSVAYAKERVQFGKPIGAQQAVQHHCANMLIDVEGMRFSTYKAAWLINEGLPCNKEVAVAKAWATEAYQRVAALGHQVHGAIAFQQDHHMYLYSKRAKLAESIFGDSSYHEEVVARELGL